MLRKILDYQLAFTQKGKPLERLYPVVQALDTFLFEAPINTRRAPHVRDAIDVKRWMLTVVYALIPCILMSIWNTGLQSYVYSSGDFKLMDEYLKSAQSFQGYVDFTTLNHRFWLILKEGLSIVLPIILISYAVGGLVEAIYAVVRKHEISEGFLVTGMLYALILPSTIPYWMLAICIAIGNILSKEVFGGVGMNIVNPALACRAFLFFTFPGRMSGDVWVGQNASTVRESLLKMNKEAKTSALDGYSQATPLGKFNISSEIKRIHVDTLATNDLGSHVETFPAIEKQFAKWNELGQHQATLTQLNSEQMKQFITSGINEGGLGLSVGYYEDAYHFSSLNYGLGHNGDLNFFFGDRLGSLGETSVLGCLIGAIFLIWTGVASWRTILGMILGAFATASLFELGAHFLGGDGGAWNPATMGFPAYKHLLLGGFAFGTIFMATDPVSSPSLKLARWIYGALAGVVTIVIRAINPAYPEGVMLAILMANVFAPLIDRIVLKSSLRRRKPQYVNR